MESTAAAGAQHSLQHPSDEETSLWLSRFPFVSTVSVYLGSGNPSQAKNGGSGAASQSGARRQVSK